MPIYEYSCPKCGQFEAIQKVSDEPLTQKPECNCADCPHAAKREVSAAAFHLKGSGWYKTDYGSKGSSGSASSSGKSGTDTQKSESSDSSGGSGESASAAKPASCGSGCGCH